MRGPMLGILLAIVLGCAAPPAVGSYEASALAWMQDDEPTAEREFAAGEQAGGAQRADVSAAKAWALAAQGDYQLRHGRKMESDASRNAARLLAPEVPGVLVSQGTAERLVGENAKARALYEQALETQPKFGPAHVALAALAMESGGGTDVVKHLVEATDPAVAPYDPEVVEIYGQFIDQEPALQPDFEHWLEGYLLAHPEDLRSHYLGGRYYLKMDNPERALALWNFVYSERPTYPNLALALGQRHFESGNHLDAARIFDALMLEAPLADYLYYAASAYANLKDWSQAHARFQRGTTEFPGDERFVLGLAQVLFEQGDPEAAAALVAPLLAGPGHASFLAYRTSAQIELARGHLETARAQLIQAVEIRPFDAWVNFNLAYLAARAGNRPEFERTMGEVFGQGYLTQSSLEGFENFAALWAIDWARAWIEQHTLIERGQGTG